MSKCGPDIPWWKTLGCSILVCSFVGPALFVGFCWITLTLTH